MSLGHWYGCISYTFLSLSSATVGGGCGC